MKAYEQHGERLAKSRGGGGAVRMKLLRSPPPTPRCRMGLQIRRIERTAALERMDCGASGAEFGSSRSPKLRSPIYGG